MIKVILPILAVAVVLLGISFYLHSIDHSTTTVVTITPIPYTATTSQQTINPATQFLGPIIAGNITIFTGNITVTKHIPPPQYASLWPETLTAGIVLLLISVLLLRRNSRDHK